MAGRRCTVCDHPEREAIDVDLAGQRAAFRHIAARTELQPSSLLRHARKCVPKSLIRSAEVERLAQGNRLGEEVARIRRHMERIADKAESDEQWSAAIAGWSASLKALDSLAKNVLELEALRQQAAEGAPITEHPQFRDFFGRVLAVLAQHPDARDAVVCQLTGPAATQLQSQDE